MADNTENVVKMARFLAILHIIVGFLLINFGVADAVTSFKYHSDGFWTGSIFFGIWIGVWMCITGGLGIPGTRTETTGSRNCFAGVFMGFSIMSAVLGGIIIICYSIMIANTSNRRYWYYDFGYDYDYGYDRRYMYDTKMAISAIILVLGIAEFVIGIWAAICCCMMNPCTCCAPQQTQQVACTATTAGYIMTQGPDGVPVAVPVQGGGGMVTMQPIGAQPVQPPMVMVSASRSAGQPVMVQAGPSATGLPPQQAEMSPTYAGHGQYARLNEEFPVKT